MAGPDPAIHAVLVLGRRPGRYHPSGGKGIRPMTALSTNEVRARAAQFAEDWKDAKYEKSETHSFYNDFFEVFGVRRRQVAIYEEPVKRLGDKRGYIDLFWKGVLIVEQKSAGRNLKKAKEQALDYFPNLKPEELPRYLLVSDFQRFELYDLDERSEVKFALANLPKHVEAFNFIRGLERRVFKDQDPVNIKAAELVGRLHDALEASGYRGHDLERFLVRIVFCLFADDTGIFDPRDLFYDFLLNRTREDGSDTGSLLIQLFDVLNTPEAERQKTLDEDLAKFPYINGQLFAERLRPPSFDSRMRKALITACEFKWDAISPAIFGSLFQSVMEPDERRRKGAHYTTELNILKLIQPLFLDALRGEFEEIRRRRGTDRHNKLLAFHDKLARLTFFDPACGCGNFLVITYRELRRLEIQVLKELHGETFQRPGYTRSEYDFDVASLSKLDVDRFYGIELEEFPALIAETAMWMMDHIMNNELSMAFGKAYARFPLKKSASIRNADALEIDWAQVLPQERCSYVFGNPPFGGSKYQSEMQRHQVRRIANIGGTGGTLDYVCAWFLKAGAYVAPNGCNAQLAFVATNSITQGEQVGQLWPLLFSRYGLEIAFAHRTFAWGSDARGKAHVHVVIVGLTKRAYEPPEKRLFSYDDVDGPPVESRHRALSPYLIDASGLRDRHLVVAEMSAPLCEVPQLVSGSQPIDDGNYIFDESDYEGFLAIEPEAKRFLRPYVGSEEYINGRKRWILWLRSASPSELRSMPHVLSKLEAVREFRRNSRRRSTLLIAEYPTRYNVEVIPDRPFLVIPEVSSERREYVPIGWLEPPTIPSNLVRVLLDADLWHFGILTSRMHMAWLRYVGGRLKSDYRYSIGIVYNTFPWPEAHEPSKEKIRKLAKSVLDARNRFPDATLADLYDANAMKPELRKAHQALDRAVDALYKRSGFASDRERVEHLFKLYEGLAVPLDAASRRRPRRSRAP